MSIPIRVKLIEYMEFLGLGKRRLTEISCDWIIPYIY